MYVKNGFYRRYVKRVMDIFLAILAIICISPILIVVALLVRIKLNSPVIFKQKRPGLNEKIFTLYKFRTMTDETDEKGELMSDKIRLTRFGILLRSTSLDELPELINVIKGDMSLIGPRPLLPQYIEIYNDYHKHRHDVRPGLSGLAQVSGRNSLDWEERLNLDVRYVNNISFISDWMIIFLTIKRIFMREGINSETAVTMEPFQGYIKKGE